MTNHTKPWIFIVIATMLLGCAPSKPSLSSSEGERLVEAVRALRATYPNSCVPRKAWPVIVAAINPNSVCIVGSDVTIEMWSLFVESRGFRVVIPDSDIETGPGSDPAIFRLAESLYWYETRG